MAASTANLLLVEGATDLIAIAELAEGNGIPWPRNNEPIDIKTLDTNTPKKSVIEGFRKRTGLRSMGIVLDADDGVQQTWIRVRSWFSHIENLPEYVPEAGYLSDFSQPGLRLGVWIMPDNRSVGTLETLLKRMVRVEADAILNHAIAATNDSKHFGATFKKVHEEKAHIFTWLAWQDEPGRNLKTIDFDSLFAPESACAQPFSCWLQNLFDIQ